MSDLLLLACSKRKLHTAGLLPAFQRYDGGAFRIVKRALREGHEPLNLAILILSAKYGLIPKKYMFRHLELAGIVQHATGRPGERQAQLRAWLWKRASTQDELPPSSRGMDR